MGDKIQGHIRESADGLRKRDPEIDQARMREVRRRAAEEAAAKRDRLQKDMDEDDLRD